MNIKNITAMCVVFFSIHNNVIGSSTNSNFQAGHPNFTKYQQIEIDGFPACIKKYSTNDEMWNKNNYIIQNISYLSTLIQESVFKDGKNVADRFIDSSQPPSKNLYDFFIENIKDN